MFIQIILVATLTQNLRQMNLTHVHLCYIALPRDPNKENPRNSTKRDCIFIEVSSNTLLLGKRVAVVPLLFFRAAVALLLLQNL